jgi:hypothetical protein
VTLCVVCTMHEETRSAGFLVEPQNQGLWFVSGSKPLGRFVSGLASKLVATISPGLASKPVATVSPGLVSKPVATVSPGLASKLVVTVSRGLASKPTARWLGFFGLGLKTDSYGLVIWASKSPRQILCLGLKTNRT